MSTQSSTATMTGAFLPGDGTVDLRGTPRPRAGHGQVVLRTRASGICGSDIHYIYNGHIGEGGARYDDVVAGHEPAGEVVEVGPGCKRLKPGDRVAVYHISGCGQCDECARGYFIGCTSESRAATAGSATVATPRSSSPRRTRASRCRNRSPMSTAPSSPAASARSTRRFPGSR
ncbi:alcohol dehydrogenase catalytic domain-containing protein [Streptomyces sp. SS52]|uniref:alcohol dehydrogenase catalytic domain-containing protein n=1 Tax=Streptomyces sp. SS52 TaxID=2563602 RepID=UPI001FF8AF85|nr:alcohol dehydrogenase catalytic domain-containing protein [Streptomyces sp. SS52]